MALEVVGLNETWGDALWCPPAAFLTRPLAGVVCLRIKGAEPQREQPWLLWHLPPGQCLSNRCTFTREL